MQVNKHVTKSRVRKMSCGSKNVSIVLSRTWEHARLDISSELETLKKLLDTHCTMGVTKARPTRRYFYQAFLNENK